MSCFFVISLPPSADSAKINIISTNGHQLTVNKTSWSNPRQTWTCYIFRLWVIIKALLKQISLYLLSHFCIRIIVVTCPDNKSARNHQPKSSVPEKSHKNHNDARPILFQLKSSLPFSLFLFVWRLESTCTTTKSLLRHLHNAEYLHSSIEALFEWRDNTDAFVALQLGRCIRANPWQCALLTSSFEKTRETVPSV